MSTFSFLLLVLVVVSAVVSDPVEVDKRSPGLLGGGGTGGGGGGLLDGLLGGNLLGGLLDTVLGEKGIVGGLLGTVGGVLGTVGGLVGGLIGPQGILSGVLGGLGPVGQLLGAVLTPVLGIVDGLLQTVVKLVSEVIASLAGKKTVNEHYSVFAKYPVEQLCPACPALKNDQYIQSCKAYCVDNGWKS